MAKASRQLPLAEFTCENGLKGSIYDRSRPTPGDRWQVEVLLVTSVPVLEEYFDECPVPSEAYRDFVAEFGENVTFQQQKVRNFISPEMKVELTQNMARQLMESVAVYVAKPDFPSKFVRKQYREWKDKEGWTRAHEDLLRHAEEKEKEP